MGKREQLIISAIGPDRVGLVRRIAGFASEHGANIEDSNMAVLADEFAIIMLVSGEPPALAALEAGRAALAERTGLTVLMRRPAAPAARAAEPFHLTASCLDHPGVVHHLTAVLSEAEVNIESLETRTQQAPESGAPFFHFEAHLAVPAHVDRERLQERLQAVGQEQNIDVRLVRKTEK